MFEYVPTFAAVGVPESWPVLELKLAHEGLFPTPNHTRFPAGSFAEGWNRYELPTFTVVAGVPEITGGDVSGFLTDIPNTGNAAVLTPSLTEILMGEYQTGLYARPGVPDSWPVLLLKLAQTGLLAIEKASFRPLGFWVVGVNE